MFCNASRPQHATLLAAVVVVASATALSLGHYEDDQASYKTGLSLLQVHADSHKLEGVGKHQRAALGDDDSARSMKAMFPYYHTSAEIRKKAELLSRDCGHAMKMETISEGGVDIDVVHVRAPKSTPVNKVFILFGEHSWCRPGHSIGWKHSPRERVPACPQWQPQVKKSCGRWRVLLAREPEWCRSEPQLGREVD